MFRKELGQKRIKEKKPQKVILKNSFKPYNDLMQTTKIMELNEFYL